METRDDRHVTCYIVSSRLTISYVTWEQTYLYCEERVHNQESVFSKSQIIDKEYILEGL